MKQDLALNLMKCEKIFDEQYTEIKRLREELQTKEHQLQSLQQEALATQKRLHEEVERLQKEKEKLIMSCKAEKEEASRQRRHVSALEKELKVWFIYCIPISTIKCNYQCLRIFYYSIPQSMNIYIYIYIYTMNIVSSIKLQENLIMWHFLIAYLAYMTQTMLDY